MFWVGLPLTDLALTISYIVIEGEVTNIQKERIKHPFEVHEPKRLKQLSFRILIAAEDVCFIMNAISIILICATIYLVNRLATEINRQSGLLNLTTGGKV